MQYILWGPYECSEPFPDRGVRGCLATALSQHRRQAKCTAVPQQIVELSHSHATWLLVDTKSKIPLLNHQNRIERTVSTHTRKRQHKRLQIASASSNIFEVVVANKA